MSHRSNFSLQLHALAAAVALAAFAGYAPAQSKPSDPTPRRGMGPAELAKVAQYEAKRWRGFGGDTTSVTQLVQAGVGGKAGCVTNIGAAPAATLQGDGNSGRYGLHAQAESQPVIITGDVISVCK